MKKLFSFILALSLFSNLAFGECDFSTGITPGPNKTYIYTEACHLAVGELVQSNATKDAQLADLNKAIELKDLAISKADSRTQLWINTNDQLSDRLNKIESLEKGNAWLAFGLGALTVFAAGYMASQLIKR